MCDSIVVFTKSGHPQAVFTILRYQYVAFCCFAKRPTASPDRTNGVYFFAHDNNKFQSFRGFISVIILPSVVGTLIREQREGLMLIVVFD